MHYTKILIDMILKQFDMDEDKRKIVVFGAGVNGIKLEELLQKSGIQISFFCDNDTKKQGQIINNVPCISVYELEKYKNEAIVFISTYTTYEIRKQLEEKEITNVVPDELIKLLRFLPNSMNGEYFNNLPWFGHYYSLYPDMDEIMTKQEEIFSDDRDIKDINLNEEGQVKWLRKMGEMYASLPKWVDIHEQSAEAVLRYRIGNPSLSLGDAVGLHCMLRLIKPKKLIEVGSGYTSAVTLDTNQFYLDSAIDLTFIEPYPNTLKAILRESDHINLVEAKLQDVKSEVFEQLESGDILFIDSTHVSKVDSDVNYLFFNILPRLKKGVYIHLHDIFYPFEYPAQWIKDGIIWNELYLLRAFLQNNKNYSIVFFQNMMEKRHMEVFLEKWPYSVKPHGGSIWLRKNN